MAKRGRPKKQPEKDRLPNWSFTGDGAMGSLVASMFANDPSDHTRYNEKSKVLSPERRLVLAVISDAIYALKDGARTGAKWERRVSKYLAKQWFKSEEYRAFSFIWCCEALGWDPSWIRQGVFKFCRLKVGRLPGQQKHGGRRGVLPELHV